jgi:hypothetical protein
MKFFSLKNRIKGLVVLLMWSMTTIVSGQVSVSLVEKPANNALAVKCYAIELTNLGSKDLLLAGQNYRLYYDSEQAMLSESTLKTQLPSQYTSLKLVQHFFDVDASGFGVLPYDAHLGFINIATDLNLAASDGITIPVGKPLSIASMCFDVKEGKVPAFTWAQDDLTHTYATAFVEISKFESNTLRKAEIKEYRIEQNKLSNIQQGEVLDVKYFPNPFTDRLTITFNENLSSEATYVVSDVFGNELLKNKIPQGSKELVLNGSQLPNGALLIEIKSTDGQVSVMKAIKLK